MSDLLNGIPCSHCGKYYGHSNHCFTNTQAGVAEKLMFMEIERRHQYITYNQKKEIQGLEEKIKLLELEIEELRNE
jgi:hypothetical protein